jgi:TolB protein
VDFDGVNERLFHRCKPNLCLSPAFHPTEPSVAFSLFTGRGWNIVVKSIAGGNLRWLTSGAFTDMAPAFSPSGADVYFARQSDGGGVFAVPFAGGTIRRVTNFRSGISSPSISPDGSRMAYVSDAVGGVAYTYLAAIDGSRAEPVVSFIPGATTYYETPAWAPDGNRIAVATKISGDAAYQVALVDVRNRSTRLLTDSGINEDPAWAPDSRHIVFTSTRSGSKQLWIYDTESGDTRQLTRGTASKTPSWSRRPR